MTVETSSPKADQSRADHNKEDLLVAATVVQGIKKTDSRCGLALLST
jgi:hypothetical protein